MLDHDETTLALGGNIFPVNGSEIDHGQIESIGLPDNLLARLQSIEYLRAFSLGRIGWSVINSLLIVSGAFGLFEKQILIECGGYLTQSTKDKDTVGEDMELVVRITRRAYETNLKFRVDYIHNAVCYTEVPEERKSLLKQRNRWQRGLIDILSYHRKMIFNARYKQAGLIGIPYFFIFEMVGPLLEIQGFLAIVIGLIFGLLGIEIIILLGMAAFLMGILLSLSALLISERDAVALNFKDTIKLLLVAIFENFGWRQFISMYRIKGIFSSLRENNEWGTLKRVGFKK
jgi:cellulose synthase/poly-beta-1,6-N-acetylglucosamine synthase-like glycosyltransferase